MSTCAACGNDLRPGARFCRRCGTPAGATPGAGTAVGHSGSHYEPSTVPPEPPPPVLGPPPVRSPRPPPPPPGPVGALPAAQPEGGYWAAVGRAGDPPIEQPPGTSSAPVATMHGPRRSAVALVLTVLAALSVLVAAGVGGYLLFADDGDGSGADSGSSVQALRPTNVRASCVGANSRDGAGATTSYTPDLTLDDSPATAWRCDDDGIGHKLTLRFDAPVRLTSVGLVPGIVKTDPADGIDRFAQNNKVQRVRWLFSGGAPVEQAFAATPDLQARPVDVTTTTVVIEILAVTPGETVTNDTGARVAPTGKTPIGTVELKGQPAS